MLHAAATVDDGQPGRLLSLMDTLVDITGKRVTVLGLSFRPGTDNIRNSRAIPVIEGLQGRGAKIVACNPVAIENTRAPFPDIEYAETAAAAIVITDCEKITALDEGFNSMTTPVVMDDRRVIDRRDGILHKGLTW